MAHHPTKTIHLAQGTVEINQPLPEGDRYYLSYEELTRLFNEYNRTNAQSERKSFTAYLKFDPVSSWQDENVTEQSSTYYIDSENKAFQDGMAGNSIYSTCCDGTDYMAKLSNYLEDWTIELVYMHKEDYDEITELINDKQSKG